MSNSMSANRLEERVATLEQEVSQLRELLKPTERIKDPYKTYGMFKEHSEYDEVVRLGREYRQSQVETDEAC